MLQLQPCSRSRQEDRGGFTRKIAKVLLGRIQWVVSLGSQSPWKFTRGAAKTSLALNNHLRIALNLSSRQTALYQVQLELVSADLSSFGPWLQKSNNHLTLILASKSNNHLILNLASRVQQLPRLIHQLPSEQPFRSAKARDGFTVNQIAILASIATRITEQLKAFHTPIAQHQTAKVLQLELIKAVVKEPRL